MMITPGHALPLPIHDPTSMLNGEIVARFQILLASHRAAGNQPSRYTPKAERLRFRYDHARLAAEVSSPGYRAITLPPLWVEERTRCAGLVRVLMTE